MTAVSKSVWIFVPAYQSLCLYIGFSPLFCIGILLLGGLPFTNKLKETLDQPIPETLNEEDRSLGTNMTII